MCFQPALGDRTDEESCGRLMEMLFKSVLSRECSSEKLGSRDGDAGRMKGIQRWVTSGWAWERRVFVYGAWRRSSFEKTTA